MIRRRALMLSAIGACAIAPATALSAGPAWHPPSYPSAPAAGLPGQEGSPMALGVGPGGRATLLYGASKGDLYQHSRTSARGAWQQARRWRAGTQLKPDSEIAVALGGKLTALWTAGGGNLFTATGTQRRATGRSFVSNAAGSPSVAATRGGVAYAFGRGVHGTPGVFAGASPARTKLADPGTVASFTDKASPAVQSGVDAAGNQTVAWSQNGMTMVATGAAGSSAWSAPTALPGSSGGAFALSVAPNGAAAVAYVADETTRTQQLSPGIDFTFQLTASIAVVQRPGAGAHLWPPQNVYTYALAPGAPIPLSNFPTALTAATNGRQAAVGIVWQNAAGGPAFLLTRGALGGTFPAPTSTGDPYVPNGDSTSYTLTRADMAIDRAGNAVFAAGGNVTQGQPDSVIASTSTTSSPAWTTGKDVADCPDRRNSSEGVAYGPDVVASPSGGVVVAWVCESAGGSARGLVGMTSFDALGPPVVTLRTRGRRVTFTLGETARYLVTATKGGRRVRVGGKATAGKRVSRALRLSPGRWRVTLRATLPSGNSTTTSRTTRV